MSDQNGYVERVAAMTTVMSDSVESWLWGRELSRRLIALERKAQQGAEGSARGVSSNPPRRTQGQMVQDAEADRQAARDGYNPNR